MAHFFIFARLTLISWAFKNFLLQMLHACYVYFLSKFTEFVDTVSRLGSFLSTTYLPSNFLVALAQPEKLPGA